MKVSDCKKISDAISTLEQMRDDLQPIAESEREAVDNLSERAQESEKGQARTEALEALESAMESIDEVIDRFNDAMVRP